MIQFRQKEFILGTVAMVVPQMVQSHNQNKKATEQQEEFQRQNARLQQKQNEAMNKIAKAAETDPSKAQAAAGILQQKSYTSLGLRAGVKLRQAVKRGGQVVYDFARGIGPEKVAKHLGSGLAMGATMAAGGYVVDKLIQRDRARITGGAPLPKPEKSPEEKKKERNKKLTKLAVGATALAGTALAARKGVFGKGFENLSKGLGKSGKPINGKAIFDTAKKHFKGGITLGSLGTGAAFGALTNAGYLSERKQLKEQAAQQNAQKQYSEGIPPENPNPNPKKRKIGSVMKKVAIGTAATVGTVATLRRVGPVGVRKSINELYMTYGKKLAGKAGNGKLGNWMMKSGSQQWGKAQAKVAEDAIRSRISAASGAAKDLADPKKLKKLQKKFKLEPQKYQDELNKLKNLSNQGSVDRAKEALSKFDNAEFRAKFAESAGQRKLDLIKSGDIVKSGTNSRKLGEGLIGGIGSIFGAGKRTTSGYLAKMSRTGTGNTKKTADWLLRHKGVGLTGGVAIGSLTFKPWGWGDTAVKKTLGAVDKNAFAYEKSKEQQVPQQ